MQTIQCCLARKAPTGRVDLDRYINLSWIPTLHQGNLRASPATNPLKSGENNLVQRSVHGFISVPYKNRTRLSKGANIRTNVQHLDQGDARARGFYSGLHSQSNRPHVYRTGDARSLLRCSVYNRMCEELPNITYLGRSRCRLRSRSSPIGVALRVARHSGKSGCLFMPKMPPMMTYVRGNIG